MARRFILVPSGTFTDTADWESVALEPDQLPASLYLDFDPNEPSTLTKDGSNLVSSWRNTLGAGDLNTAASGSAYPTWVDAQLNGYPVIDCNNGGTKTLATAGNILHNLSLGYSWAAVAEAFSGGFNTVLWNSSTTGSGATSVFSSTNRVWRNNGSESVVWGTGTFPSAWTVYLGRYNPTGHTMDVWQDGVQLPQVVSAGLPGADRKLMVGGNSVIFGRIRFARFMFFNATLTNAEANAVNRILQTRYGLL